MEKWEKKQLGDVADIRGGFTPSRTIEEYWNKKEIPWFTVEDIRKQGRIINFTEQYISKKALSSKERIVPRNSVLLCCTASIGEYAFTNITLTTNQQFNGITVKDKFINDIDIKYIYYWTMLQKPKLIRNAGQTTFGFVSKKKLSNFVIFIPSLKMQKKIIQSIESQFEKIDTTVKDLDNAKKKSELYKLQLLKYAISGRLTEQLESDGIAEDLNRDIQDEKERLIKEKKIKQEKYVPIEDDEIPFEIPENWKWCRLDELLIKHVGGGTPSRRIQSYWNGNIPWASVKDLNCISLTNTLEAITEEGLNNSSSNVIKKGNIIVCTRVGVGKIVFNDIDVAINQDLRGLFFNNKILMKFFYYYYLTLDFKGRGTTVKGISVNELKNTLVPLPPLAEQRRIVKILEEKLSIIDNNIKLIENMLNKCEMLKQSILNQYFGGYEECKL